MAAPASAGAAASAPTDLTGVAFRDQRFLDFVGGFLSAANVFDYFANSQFYDPKCNNEQLRRAGVHPLDAGKLKSMVGWEYALHDVREPLLFVLKKQKRDSPEKVTASAVYHILDGTIYQAPTAHAIITSRMARSLHHLNAAFGGFRKLLSDKPKEKEAAPKAGEAAPADAAQVSRVDTILWSALARLPPCPQPKLLQPAPAAAPPGTDGNVAATPNLDAAKEEGLQLDGITTGKRPAATAKADHAIEHRSASQISAKRPKR